MSLSRSPDHPLAFLSPATVPFHLPPTTFPSAAYSHFLLLVPRGGEDRIIMLGSVPIMATMGGSGGGSGFSHRWLQRWQPRQRWPPLCMNLCAFMDVDFVLGSVIVFLDGDPMGDREHQAAYY
uniref:Uncharacterized protein n=1 Tax=Oryza punctata TaxID=4537 RepID=A0A0E0LK22_ORYPU